MFTYQYLYITPSQTFQNFQSQNTGENRSKQLILQPQRVPQSHILTKKGNGSAQAAQDFLSAQISNSKKLKTTAYDKTKQLKKNMKNHNVFPNIMNSVLSYIRRTNKTRKIVEKIINKFYLKGCSTNFNVGKYFAYQNYLYSKIPKSKHQGALKFIMNHLDSSLEAFSVEEQLFYNKICRILIMNLLNQEFLLAFLTSRKCSKTTKQDQLKARNLIAVILKEENKSSTL